MADASTVLRAKIRAVRDQAMLMPSRGTYPAKPVLAILKAASDLNAALLGQLALQIKTDAKMAFLWQKIYDLVDQDWQQRMHRYVLAASSQPGQATIVFPDFNFTAQLVTYLNDVDEYIYVDLPAVMDALRALSAPLPSIAELGNIVGSVLGAIVVVITKPLIALAAGIGEMLGALGGGVAKGLFQGGGFYVLIAAALAAGGFYLYTKISKGSDRPRRTKAELAPPPKPMKRLKAASA